jgi:hypothetical protein
MASAPEAIAVTLPELVIVKGLSAVAKTSVPLIALLIVRAIDVAPSQPAELIKLGLFSVPRRLNGRRGSLVVIPSRVIGAGKFSVGL